MGDGVREGSQGLRWGDEDGRSRSSSDIDREKTGDTLGKEAHDRDGGIRDLVLDSK